MFQGSNSHMAAPDKTEAGNLEVNSYPSLSSMVHGVAQPLLWGGRNQSCPEPEGFTGTHQTSGAEHQ